MPRSVRNRINEFGNIVRHPTAKRVYWWLRTKLVDELTAQSQDLFKAW